MALDEIIDGIVDSGVPEATDNGLDLFSGLETAIPGGADFADLSGVAGSGGAGLLAWLKANPEIAGALYGGSGPLMNLIGSLGSGGISGTTGGTSNSSGSSSSSGFNNQQASGFSNQDGSSRSDETSNTSGYNNATALPIIDPAAQGAMDRLTGMLGGNAGSAQGAYDQGLNLLQQLATGQMNAFTNGEGGASPLAGPNTTPQPAPVTGFPTQLPTAYNPAIGNLIKQAFGSFVGDLGASAITNARNRGFAGGGDLLNSAAAPMMGQTLAQVPAMQAKAYMDHVLQAYGLESENAARRSSAEAGALNAATNALGPGVAKYGADVTKYGIDRSQDNNQLAQMTSLLNSLMGPQDRLMAGNLSLLANAPRGTQSNSLSGQSGNRSLSGTTQNQSITGSQTQQQTGSQSQQQQAGSQSGQTGTPIPNVIGQGIGNIIGGAGVGAVAGGAPDFTGAAAKNAQQSAQAVKSILALLGKA